MRHYMARTNRHKVATAHHRIWSEPVGMASGNLLNERKAHSKMPYYFAHAGAC